MVLGVATVKLKIICFPTHPRELDGSRVIPARWRKDGTRDIRIKFYAVQFGF